MIGAAASEAQHSSPGIATEAFAFVGRLLALDPTCPEVAAHPREALGFALRWQQLTGAVAAKGVEDTALYRDLSPPT